jgi:hypothetical protein
LKVDGRAADAEKERMGRARDDGVDARANGRGRAYEAGNRGIGKAEGRTRRRRNCRGMAVGVRREACLRSRRCSGYEG